jgi:type II secretory ATPase GspE/PulE/Tfp pilus assembly ATPase PilB-like protein
MLFSHKGHDDSAPVDPVQDAAQATPPHSILSQEALAELERLYGSPQTAPEIIDLLLKYAVQKNISDILFEPNGEYILVRMRLDGVLQEAARVPVNVHPAVVARVKVLATLDTANSRQLTLEGKFIFSVDGRAINARVAITLVAGGEMIAMRLHDSASAVTPLQSQGMDEQVRTTYENMLTAKTGLIIVCGPTGAGKTSTLYSSLAILNTGKTNIISIEDPVEYVMKGINQMQVDQDKGLTFASGLRVILRLNPDIILVGEVRDKETAQIAIESSLTGHLVLSTLHANSAVSAISRLRDLQVEDFLISAAVKGIMCQRLVRKSCQKCGVWKEPFTTERQIFKQIMGRELEKQFVGSGCDKCAGTGFDGRIGVYELIQINETVRQLVGTIKSEQEMFMALRQQGFRSLVEDGMLKAEQGITTVMEVISNAYSD